MYGYDDGKREFMMCDNAMNGKYSTDIRCTYEEMRAAYGNYVPDNVKLDLHDSILLIAPTEDRFEYEFSVRVFEAQVREYLNIAPASGGRERGGVDIRIRELPLPDCICGGNHPGEG